MEAKLQTKKRKHQPPSNNPFTGVFSRSKSQIYLHRNRSGKSRSDTVPKQRHHQILISPPPNRKRRAIRDPEAVDPETVSRTPVKDLRSRRVFSPGAPIGDDCAPDGGNRNSKPKPDCDLVESGALEKIRVCSVAEKCVTDETLINLTIDLSPGGVEVVRSDCRNPNFSVAEEEAQKAQNDKIDSQMANVSIAPKLDDAFNGINNDNRLVSQVNHKSKLVGGSCTRQKVFKSPGSFSYRRMLPFLQDISADDFGASNTEKPSLGDSCNAQSLEKTNPKAADAVSNGVDEMGEGDVQMTPPDPDIFLRPEVKDNRRNGDGIGVPTQDHVSITPLKGCLKRNDRFTPEVYHRPTSQKTGYSPKSNLVLTPCSRVKKLKTVTSFSYRRLLPYLMESRNRDSDISNDTSRCAQLLKVDDASENKIPGPAVGSRFGNIPNGTSKTDSSAELETAASTLTCETGLLTTNHVTLSSDENTLTSDENIPSLVLSNSLKECTSPVEQCLSNKPEKVQSVLNDANSNLDESRPAPPLFEDTDSEASNQHDKLKPATSVKNNTLLDGEISKDATIIEVVNIGGETSQSVNDESEISQVQEVIQKICKSLELEPDSSSSNFEPAPQTMTLGMPADTESPLKNSPSPLKKSPGPSKSSPSPLKNSRDLSLGSQDGNQPKDAKPSELVSSDETFSPLEEFIPSGNVVDGRARGILRRNPRGCRGLCNCLSCSSFRLHADKAFEFSKNQLLDAEEVAEELIKEMSHLRDMLEKYSSDANGHASLCVSQVKDACLKASKAEELAKHRLSEMNCDLTIHCRTMQLQRPKVRFANQVQETTIPKIGEKNK